MRSAFTPQAHDAGLPALTDAPLRYDTVDLAASALLPRCARASAGPGRATRAARAGLTAGAACPTLAAVAARSTTPAGAATPACAVAAGRGIDTRPHVDAATKEPTDRACVGGGRGSQRG